MGRRRFIAVVAILSTAVTAASVVFAQTGASPAGPPPGPRPVVYPPRAFDPAAAARGRVLYDLQGCAGCHASDIRGGTAPALHRSAVVLNDVRGEAIGPFLAAGLPGNPGHVFKLERPQAVDLADFLHSIPVSGNGTAGIISRVPSILTGSAAAGQVYFAKACASCHSVGGDLAGLGTRLGDPTALQQRWLAPRARLPITATVNSPGGPVSGEVTALDEFSITLKTTQGERVIPRKGEKPRIVIKDPLAGHAAILRRITDDNIHDVTAYLVTLK